MSNKPDNSTPLMREAATFGKEILDQLAAEKPDDAKRLAELLYQRRVQFDVRIRDMLGKGPSVQLIAVMAEGEQVVGTRLMHHPSAPPV